jgi:hypothetical protein
VIELKLTDKILIAESNPQVTQRDVNECYTSVIDELLEWFEKANDSGSSSVFSALQNRIDTVRDDLRESAQALTRQQMWAIITRLRTDEPIRDEDLRLIRLWLIGDAEAYVAEENNFDEWVEEIQRLEEEVRRLRSSPVNTDAIKQLQAVLTDTRGVIPNIANYLTDRERVAHFEETMSHGLQDGKRESLASILQASYDSRER